MTSDASQSEHEPAGPLHIPYYRSLSQADFRTIHGGLRPESMEDKWFGDLCIVLGRSWTGKHIYILPIIPHIDGWLAREILVIGSFGLVYSEAEHVELVERILSRWLATEMPGEG